MNDRSRTAFAPSGPALGPAELLAFPASRVVRPSPAADARDDRVRVEYRGQVKVYRDRAHLEDELRGPAPRLTAGDQLRRWGWLLVLALGAAAMLWGAV